MLSTCYKLLDDISLICSHAINSAVYSMHSKGFVPLIKYIVIWISSTWYSLLLLLKQPQPFLAYSLSSSHTQLHQFAPIPVLPAPTAGEMERIWTHGRLL